MGAEIDDWSSTSKQYGFVYGVVFRKDTGTERFLIGDLGFRIGDLLEGLFSYLKGYTIVDPG